MTNDPLYIKALDFATEAHKGQTRKFSGAPYITHPVAVAEIAVKLWMSKYAYDKSTLVTIAVVALLHDTIEDTNVDYHNIKDLFGVAIANYVLNLTRGNGESYLDYIIGISQHAAYVEKIVKLADLTHNMSDLPKFKTMYDKYSLAKHIITQSL